MPTTKKTRKTLTPIERLEKARKSKVIVYITGDRKPAPFTTQIANDIIEPFKNILKKIGKTKKITLALYTNGGHLDTPWPLVNIIREYCDEFEVIVVDRALSAGTMIALGADKIVMGPQAFLSPVDPAANFKEENDPNPKRFEVEDIIGYIDFVKEKIGITEQQALTEIMKDLTKEVNPTRLGSVNRTHALVRRLSRKLLGLHNETVSERDIEEITEHLTEKLFSHKHLISRREACEIGLKNIVEFSDNDTEKATDAIYRHYVDYLKMREEFNPINEIDAKEVKKDIKLSLASIHSADMSYDFSTTCVVTKTPDPQGNPGFAANIVDQRWSEVK